MKYEVTCCDNSKHEVEGADLHDALDEAFRTLEYAPTDIQRKEEECESQNMSKS